MRPLVKAFANENLRLGSGTRDRYVRAVLPLGGGSCLEAPREDIEAVSWQRAPDIGTVWVYVPVGPSGEAVVNCLRRTRNFRFSSYIDVAVEGDLE